MIMRVWHGWTKPENADAYESLLRNDVLPGIRKIEGYRGTWLLRRPAGDEVEFITMTTWESWDAIERFAGPGRTKAVVHERAARLLTRYDDESTHYEGVWVE